MKNIIISMVSSVGLMGSVAFAGNTDFIVRLRDPMAVKALDESINWEREGGAAVDALTTVNEDEGLYHLNYASDMDAAIARENLLNSGRVLSIAPNLEYRPAVHYGFHAMGDEGLVSETANSLEGASLLETPMGKSFLSLPLVSGSGGHTFQPRLVTNPIPEVSLPPANMQRGADPLATKDWAISAIHLDQVDANASGAPITAAVIDTGVDYNHEDIVGGLWRKPGNAKEVGYDFAHNIAKPYDVIHFDLDGCFRDLGCRVGKNTDQFLTNAGHGTHCAGHVGAATGNALGIRGFGGASTRVVALKFFHDYGEQGAGRGDDKAAIQSIDYAIKNGVKVISASWGGRQTRADALQSELLNALKRAQAAGILVVIAAGNDSIDQDSVADPSFPAAYDLDNLLIVAASDSQDQIATFSNYGAKSVHIAAPGVKVFSTVAGSKYDDAVARTTAPNGKQIEIDWDGTSMATPVVAGAAALVWSRYPRATYQEIRQRLISTARPVAGLAGKISSGGVLDVAAALR